MKPASFSRSILLLLLALVACARQPIATATLTAPAFTPTPTIDPGIITPENAAQLVQSKQMGMGEAIGPPVFSPDGKWLYQATKTGVFAFDTASYATTRLVAPFSGMPSSDDRSLMALSPDGKYLALGNDLVLAESGRKVFSLDVPWQGTQVVKFSPDGSLLARGYYTDPGETAGHIGVWRVADGSLVRTFDGKGVGELEFSTDGHYLSTRAAFSGKSPFDVFDVRTGDQLTNWNGNPSVFLPGNLLAVESDGTIRIYDLATGKVIHVFYGRFIGASPDGSLLALLSFDRFKIYRVSDEQLVASLEAYSTNHFSASARFSPDGQTLAIYAADYCCGGIASQTLSIWRLAGGVLIKKVDKPGDLFTFSPDGKTLAVTIRNASTQIINTADGSLEASAGAYNLMASSVAFLPDGKHLAVVGVEDNNGHDVGYHPPLYFYDVDSGALTGRQPANAKNGQYSSTSDGKVYASGALDGLRRPGWEWGDCGTSFSPDGKRVATGYTNMNGSPFGFIVWDLSTRTMLLSVSDLPALPCSLSFSANGQRLAVAFQGDTLMGNYHLVRVWDIAQAKMVMELDAAPGVNMVTYSPDGRYLAAGGSQGVLVWNASDGSLRFSIDSPVLDYLSLGQELVSRLAFSPDGRILALGTARGTLELWNMQKGEKIYSAQVTYAPQLICDVAFSPDGRLLAVASQDGGIRIFGIK
jgi:WD40 repeat protein